MTYSIAVTAGVNSGIRLLLLLLILAGAARGRFPLAPWALLDEHLAPLSRGGGHRPKRMADRAPNVRQDLDQLRY